VIEGVFGEIAEQFAKGFRTVEAMAFNKFIYLLEALLRPDSETVCDGHSYNGVTNGASGCNAGTLHQ
jgi:hypothetical protein